MKLLVEDTRLNTHDNGLKRRKRSQLSQLLMRLEEEVCQN
jgi:hypothetical protein